MRAPVSSDKHEIVWSNLAQDVTTPGISVELIKGVPPATKDQAIPAECVIGSRVNSIYLEFHFSPATTAAPNIIHWVVEIQRTGQTNSVSNTYYQSDRSQILKRGMEMLVPNVSTVFKRIVVVKIPRFIRRVKDDTKIRFRYTGSGADTVNACGFAIYKEIT